MNKIKEIVIEPSKIYLGSIFKLKVKAIRYLTYQELKENQKTYNNTKMYNYKVLKGD